MAGRGIGKGWGEIYDAKHPVPPPHQNEETIRSWEDSKWNSKKR